MTTPATNRVLAHTGARYPIIQAPMGWIARTQLASAVSRAGGGWASSRPRRAKPPTARPRSPK